MQRIDVLIVGALLVAGAGSLIGVLTYEDDRLGDFAIEWRLRTRALEAEPATHAGAGEVETTLDVPQPNLTRITFTVTVTGAAARVQPTAVRVEVVSPANETTAVEGELPVGPTASIELPVEVTLAPVPDAPSVRGPTLDAARHALNATLSSSFGVGAWTIRASLAPTAPGPLGNEPHTVAVAAELEWYEAELSIDVPEVPR